MSNRTRNRTSRSIDGLSRAAYARLSKEAAFAPTAAGKPLPEEPWRALGIYAHRKRAVRRHAAHHLELLLAQQRVEVLQAAMRRPAWKRRLASVSRAHHL